MYRMYCSIGMMEDGLYGSIALILTVFPGFYVDSHLGLPLSAELEHQPYAKRAALARVETSIWRHWKYPLDSLSTLRQKSSSRSL